MHDVGGLVVVDHSAAAPYRLIDTFSSIALNPHATGPARLELGVHQFGLLAGVVVSIEYLASLDESATGTRRERLTLSMQTAASYMNWLFDYLLTSLRSLPLVMVIGRPELRIPVLSFAVDDIPAEQVVQRLADNGILAISEAHSRMLDVIGVNDIGSAVTVGLAR
jgi:selenocysteine lyase/cysteine desulfurase